jgi:hypothetical protein
MIKIVRLCVSFLASTFRFRAALQAENLALRHQLSVYQRSIKRPKVRDTGCILWSLLARAQTRWKDRQISMFDRPKNEDERGSSLPGSTGRHYRYERRAARPKHSRPLARFPLFP